MGITSRDPDLWEFCGGQTPKTKAILPSQVRAAEPIAAPPTAGPPQQTCTEVGGERFGARSSYLLVTPMMHRPAVIPATADEALPRTV